MRTPLVKPACLAVVRITRKNAARPFVIAGTLIGIPGTRIGRAVVEKIELRIIGNPAPHRAAARMPGAGWPGRHPEIFPWVLGIKRLELWANEHIRIWPSVVGFPGNVPVVRRGRRYPAPFTHLTAAIAHQHLILHDQGAIVIVSPLLISPNFVFQTSLPVCASTATVCPSSVL